jgi:plastocyanin
LAEVGTSELPSLDVRRLFAVVVLVAAIAVGCGDDGDPSGAGGDGPPDATLLEGDAVEIDAIDNSFQPEAARVAAGTEVTFVNAGRNSHNVVPEDDDAEWGVDTDDFQPGDSSSYTFDEPGTYRFFCSIHGTLDAGMPGVLVVE